MRRAALLGLLLLASCARPAATDAPGAATVVRVVDGDTVVVDLGGHEETIRLLGVNTSSPPLVHP